MLEMLASDLLSGSFQLKKQGRSLPTQSTNLLNLSIDLQLTSLVLPKQSNFLPKP
jgi:hypothetical protein